MVAFANDGKAVALAVPEDAHEPLSVLVIAGAPFHGPVLRYGPFVMNTEAEIRQALIDYQHAWSASVLPVSPLSPGRSTTDLKPSSTCIFGSVRQVLLGSRFHGMVGQKHLPRQRRPAEHYGRERGMSHVWSPAIHEQRP
jgi:hypothetical protein